MLTELTVRSPRRRASGFATAADTLDIDALIRDLDGQGANSTSYRQSVIPAGDVVTFAGFSGRRRLAA